MSIPTCLAIDFKWSIGAKQFYSLAYMKSSNKKLPEDLTNSRKCATKISSLDPGLRTSKLLPRRTVKLLKMFIFGLLFVSYIPKIELSSSVLQNV